MRKIGAVGFDEEIARLDILQIKLDCSVDAKT